MAKAIDINNPPPGGFQYGGWYWDPSVKQARQWTGNTFGAPGVVAIGAQQTSAANEGLINPSASPLDNVNKVIEDSFTKLQSEVRSRFGEYQAGKPFRVDEVLAEKTSEAKEQIDPYYNEIVSDYLTGVTSKISRGEQDTKDLLGELKATTDSYTGNTLFKLTEAINKAGEGFADAGLFDSGKRMRTEGVMTTETQSDLGDFNRQQAFKEKQLTGNLARGVEDTLNAKRKDIREIERSRFTDVQAQAGQLAKEAGQDYIRGFQATLPTELQSASGFDMLKSLGIYS